MFKLQGNYGSLHDIFKFQKHNTRTQGSNPIRQCNNSLIPGVHGGTEQTNIGHSNVYLVFCNRGQYFDQFKASTRYRKRRSGQTVQTQMPIRMSAASQGFQTFIIQMGTIYRRQV